MAIQINDKFQIDHDRFNWILQEKRIIQEGAKKGEVRVVDIGYYGSLHQALCKLLEQELKEGEYDSIQDLQTTLLQAHNDLKKAIKGIKKGD